MTWIPITQQLPPNGEVVETKIDNGLEVRNIQDLKRQGNLWWHTDGKMYVYYTPTHWRKKEGK